MHQEDAGKAAPDKAKQHADPTHRDETTDRRWKRETKNHPYEEEFAHFTGQGICFEVRDIPLKSFGTLKKEPAHVGVVEASEHSNDARSMGVGRVRIAFSVALLMMLPVRPDPLHQRALNRHRSKNDEECAYKLWSFETLVREQPVEANGDAEHADEVHPDKEPEVCPIEQIAPEHYHDRNEPSKGKDHGGEIDEPHLKIALWKRFMCVRVRGHRRFRWRLLEGADDTRFRWMKTTIDCMSKSTVLREATFDKAVCRYWLLSGTFLLFVCIVTIPLIPVWWIVGLTLTKKYLDRMSCTLTEKTLIVRKGLFNRVEKTVPLEKITDLALQQGPLMRAMNLKALSIETAGSSGGAAGGALIALIGIEDTDGFRDTVLAQRDTLAAATQHGSSSSPSPAADATILEDIRDTLGRIEHHLKKQSS